MRCVSNPTPGQSQAAKIQCGCFLKSEVIWALPDVLRECPENIFTAISYTAADLPCFSNYH